MVTRSKGAACPCGGRYIDHWADTPAPDAEALMRSRYSAFVRGDAAYLQASWHASTRPATLTLEAGVHWLGLQVRAHHRLDDTHAEVEFVARSRVGGGPAQRLHERSRFVRERADGAWRWFYVDGVLL